MADINLLGDVTADIYIIDAQSKMLMAIPLLFVVLWGISKNEFIKILELHYVITVNIAK